MKKDKEWLRKEVEEYLNIEGCYDARTALKAVLEYIDQVDESEITEEQALKKLAESYPFSADGINSILQAQLVGFRPFSIMEFIQPDVQEEVVCAENEHTTPTISKMESVVIPQFVADWIEDNKQHEEKWSDYSAENALSDTIHFVIYGLYANYPITNSHVEKRKPVLEWLEIDRNNYFKLVDAVRHGCEIEIEPPKTRQVLVKFFDNEEYRTELTEDAAKELIEFLEANKHE